MKNMSTRIAALFAVVLLSGCGSISPISSPLDGYSLSTPPQPATPSKKVTVVMLQEDRSLFGVTEERVLEQVKELLADSKQFGAIDTDPDATYAKPGDLPSPQPGEYLLGVTIAEKGFIPSRAAHLGKFFLNLATLTISSTIIPFNMDHSSQVTLTLIDENGTREIYASEAVIRNSWSSWSFGRLKTFVGARVLAHTQAMTSAVNRLVAGVAPETQTSALADENHAL